MIRNSFIFLEGVKSQTERNIWEQGISDWQEFLDAGKVKGMSAKRKGYYDRKIVEARESLYNLDSSYFVNKLPAVESWRLYEFFKEDAVFLDIETSEPSGDGYITVFGMFDGFETKVMVKDMNLDFDVLQKELKKYKLIVTFNGSVFDIPFIRKRYPDLIPDIPCVDLRFLCSRIGISGGLKQVEKKIGVKRVNRVVDGMHGGDPITLWRIFRATGNEYYVNLLVEYNEEDCINLKKIADLVCSRLEQDLNIC